MTAEYLTRSPNDITGKIPDWLGGLTALVALDLHHNDIEGESPSLLMSGLSGYAP